MIFLKLLSKINLARGTLSHLRDESVCVFDPILDHELAERELKFVKDFILRCIFSLSKPIDHIPVKGHNCEHFIDRSLKFVNLELPELQAPKVIEFLGSLLKL